MKNTNKKYADIATIRNTAARCREEGIPVGEKTLRRWVEEQKLPAVRTGRKILVESDGLSDCQRIIYAAPVLVSGRALIIRRIT